jgi:hypothetical protein
MDKPRAKPTPLFYFLLGMICQVLLGLPDYWPLLAFAPFLIVFLVARDDA